LLPALSDKGKIRMIGTILHLDSLLENLMPGSLLRNLINGHKRLVSEDLREYCPDKLPWKSIKYRAHTDDYSKLLWPEMKTINWFKLKKDDYARQGLSDVYSQEMLNIPLDEENTFFRRNDFHPMRIEDKKKKLVYYGSCDLAVSLAQKTDFSAFCIAGMDDGGKLYLVHVIKERMDSLRIVDTLMMLQRLYEPVLFSFEKGVITNSIGPFLNTEMLKRNLFLNMVLLRPSVEKTTRARSIQGRMQAGAVRFDKDTEWYPGFEDELMRFPRDKHDDQVDAWAYMGLMLDRMWDAPTEIETEDEDYRLMVRKNNMESLTGRSQTTGY
jgi:predicted phage terminase large subunit-like protein